jgi:hypothetical protein
MTSIKKIKKFTKILCQAKSKISTLCLSKLPELISMTLLMMKPQVENVKRGKPKFMRFKVIQPLKTSITLHSKKGLCPKVFKADIPLQRDLQLEKENHHLSQRGVCLRLSSSIAKTR